MRKNAFVFSQLRPGAEYRSSGTISSKNTTKQNGESSSAEDLWNKSGRRHRSPKMLLGPLSDVRDRLAHIEAAGGEMKDGVVGPGLISTTGSNDRSPRRHRPGHCGAIARICSAPASANWCDPSTSLSIPSKNLNSTSLATRGHPLRTLLIERFGQWQHSRVLNTACRANGFFEG